MDYLAELRRLATPCDFGEYLNEALRDRLVCGLCNESIQKRFLPEVGLKITVAQSLEAAEQESQGLQQTHKQISLVSKKAPPIKDLSSVRRHCYRCGHRNHTAETCFYKDTDCHLCRGKGPLAKMCKLKLTKGYTKISSKSDKGLKWVETKKASDSGDADSEFALFFCL